VNLTRLFGLKAEDFSSRSLATLRQALPVEEVWILGSCARGEAKPGSNLDMLVVLADNHGLARPTRTAACGGSARVFLIRAATATTRGCSEGTCAN